MALGNEPFSHPAEDDEQLSEEEDSFSDESSDSEEDESVDYTSVPKAFEPILPRSLKRTYGVVVDDLRSERQIKNARLDEQLAFLRAIIPARRDEKSSVQVLMDTHKYILHLQSRVEDLNSELVPQKPPAPEPRPTAPVITPLESDSPQPPTVEVTRKEGKLGVRIMCVNRPGLLLDIMGALTASRMTVSQATIACHHNVLFEAFSLEKDATNKDSNATEVPSEAEEEGVKENIVRAICQ